MRNSVSFLTLTLSILTLSCTDNNKPTPEGPAPIPQISFSVTATNAHDTAYFTEGLEFYKNTIIESAGNYGKSKLVQLDAATGKVLKSIDLDPKEFGEGITVLRDTVYQLTWKENIVHAYDVNSFKKIGDYPLKGEGWGLTNDGKKIIASNGSSDLFFYEPGTFKLIGSKSVTENGNYVPNLNELEYLDGFVYANQWNTNYIYKIDIETGNVVGKLDFSSFANEIDSNYPDANEMNGIAYNPANKKFYITGKNWPRIFEVELSK